MKDLIMPVTESGCWVWMGLMKHAYGYTMVKGRAIAAHRVFYESAHGPIPDGLVLDHLCRVPCCVNPAHLEPVTERENILRGIGRGALYAKRSQCHAGHPFTEETCRVRRGARICLICKNAQARKRYSELSTTPIRTWQSGRICEIPGCGAPYCAKGLCGKHYQRLKGQWVEEVIA